MTDERQERPPAGSRVGDFPGEPIGHVIDLYVLDPDGTTRRVDHMSEWSAMQAKTRRVLHSVVGEAGSVSTIFTGIDHGTYPDGVPLLFETAVKRGSGMWEPAGRTATRADALVLHGRLVEELKAGQG
jgi:hypothetical protein